MDKFEKQVDPDGLLTPKERARRAAHARKSYFAGLALKSYTGPGPAEGGREGTLHEPRTRRRPLFRAGRRRVHHHGEDWERGYTVRVSQRLATGRRIGHCHDGHGSGDVRGEPGDARGHGGAGELAALGPVDFGELMIVEPIPWENLPFDAQAAFEAGKARAGFNNETTEEYWDAMAPGAQQWIWLANFNDANSGVASNVKPKLSRRRETSANSSESLGLPRLRHTPATDIEATKPVWIWKGWLEAHSVALMAARQGRGKTTHAAWIVAQASRAVSHSMGVPVRCAILSLEEPAEAH